MVARTISARRSDATPRSGLMPLLFDWSTNYLSRGPRTSSRAAAAAWPRRGRALVGRAAAAFRRALGFQPLEVDRRVIGEGHRGGEGGMALGDEPVHRLADPPVRRVSLRGRPKLDHVRRLAGVHVHVE